MDITLETDLLEYTISGKGTNRGFVDKSSGKNHVAKESPFASVKANGKYTSSTSISLIEGQARVEFGESGIVLRLEITTKSNYLIVEVISIEGENVEELTFLDLDLALEASLDEEFGGCVLALNLKTNVAELPGPSKHLGATCYARFGIEGASAALIACPPDMMRGIIQSVVSSAEGLPRSPTGGPWALDSKKNRGSYLFNTGDLSEERVDEWIELARSLGVTQIDFHGGTSFRFGDFLPNPETYPEGLRSLRAVTDRLREAGIISGFHTYAFFIDKRCPWVTPVPDPRLGRDATFTLAEDIGPDDEEVPVIESTESMSTTTGFFVRNSVTLQIDDELVTYEGIEKKPPYSFTKCQRGALGTTKAGHGKGTTLHHLKECFGLFTPDADSSLLVEVAEKTARAINEGGFDMTYLDALDGEDVLGGREWGWHYGSRFVFEIFRRLERPVMMEASTFHHHLWYVRSRMGAWDTPSRSHKKFIDIHVESNEEIRRIFLPTHLGWWAFKTWGNIQVEPTFPDDIEYLCCKALATDSGLSVMGIDPDKAPKVPALPRLAEIVRKYEKLRTSGYFSEDIRARLRVPGDEFTLFMDDGGRWRFRPVEYSKHRMEGLGTPGEKWSINNPFGSQNPGFRIEALYSAAPYDSPDSRVIVGSDEGLIGPETADADITAEISVAEDSHGEGKSGLRYRAANANSRRKSTWTRVERVFSPTLDISNHQAIGVWINGDGKGEVLNIQLRSPQHLTHAIGEHYVIIDFTGWRYFQLIEPEGERYADYEWPYGHSYSIYREAIDYAVLERLSLFFNNIPAQGEVECQLSPIKALPLRETTIKHPRITINGRTITFPVDLDTGSYLEFNSISDCRVYGPEGELLCEVEPIGEVPVLDEGENELSFYCDAPGDVIPRARITTISRGEPL
jgi:hypothetical protein